MARKVANVDIITDSFEIWLLETNELLHALSTEIITANTTYANTGNSTISRTAQLWGNFGANSIVVAGDTGNTATSGYLRGGNVNGSYANLLISTNTIVSNNAYANLQVKVSNTTTFSYVNPHGGYFGNTAANSYINATAIITQNGLNVNTNISPTLIQVANSTSTANITAISFATGIFQANTIEMQVGEEFVANSSALLIGNSTVNAVHSNGQSLISNSSHSANLTYTGLKVGNASINSTANSTAITIREGTNSTFSNTSVYSVVNTTSQSTLTADYLVVLENANTGLYAAEAIDIGSTSANLKANSTQIVFGSATANVVANSTVIKFGTSAQNIEISANTITPSTNLTINSVASVTGNLFAQSHASVANTLTVKTDLVVDVSANGNLGATTGSDLLIYTFDKSVFTGGKVMVAVKNGSNTQVSEMVLTHNGSASYLTVYGTVSSPPGSNNNVNLLGTFNTNVSTSDVRLYIRQTTANSASKVVAQLIKA